MEFAIETLTRKLKQTGMNQQEIDCLLARFLDEEAFDYVDYVENEYRKYQDKPLMLS